MSRSTAPTINFSTSCSERYRIEQSSCNKLDSPLPQLWAQISEQSEQVTLIYTQIGEPNIFHIGTSPLGWKLRERQIIAHIVRDIFNATFNKLDS